MYILTIKVGVEFDWQHLSAAKEYFLPLVQNEIEDYVVDDEPSRNEKRREILKDVWNDLDELIRVWNEQSVLQFSITEEHPIAQLPALDFDKVFPPSLE